MTETPFDVFIVGTGMVGTRQITHEVDRAFEKSETVFLIDHQSDIMSRYLEEFDTTIVNLTEEYEEGKRREETYRQMAERVMDEAEESGEPVTLALYGHPFVFVSPSRWIVTEADERGLEVKKLPGISSMDCLYADIALDPGESGLQMFEATDLLVHEHDLNQHVPAMIWQIGVVETIRHTEAASKPGRFSRIRNYLQQFYPDNHEVALLQTATYPFTDSKEIRFGLDEFESMADEINAIQTLYIPPTGKKDVQNEALMEDIKTSEHLEAITRSDETQSL